MAIIRTTLQPGKEIEVDDAEFLDLKRQGLLVGGETKTEQKANARKLTEGQEK